MAQNPQMEAQGEVVQSLFYAMLVVPMANIFDDVSYASPRMLGKPKWPHMWVIEKSNYRGKALIIEEWDNIHDPILKTNPKSLKEVAYESEKD